MEFLTTLIVSSEKAANIARAIRQNNHLFELLVEQKGTEEANPRFVRDFKTLADVLIQEMVKHDVKEKFPELADKIFGEESNEFSNKLGETICVQVKENEEATANLLLTVLNGDREAADFLAAQVHQEVKAEDVDTKIPTVDFMLDMTTLGIWIDPIDATAEYINGEETGSLHNIPLNGLKCVTVLIGAFDQTTGSPVVGVINRPFLPRNAIDFQCVWGVSTPTTKIYAIRKEESIRENKIVCLSTSEDGDIKTKLKSNGYEVVETSGAGHKLLMTILGLSDVYILSKNSTFFWDTCAPQAILNAIGGDIVIFKDLTQNNKISVEYAFSRDRINVGGIVAFQKMNVLDDLEKILHDSSYSERKNLN